MKTLVTVALLSILLTRIHKYESFYLFHDLSQVIRAVSIINIASLTFYIRTFGLRWRVNDPRIYSMGLLHKQPRFAVTCFPHGYQWAGWLELKVTGTTRTGQCILLPTQGDCPRKAGAGGTLGSPVCDFRI